jgi:hypothetical protein
MIDLNTLSKSEVETLLAHADKVEMICHRDGKQTLNKYRTHSGWIVEKKTAGLLRDKRGCFYFDLDDEPNLSEIIESICSHLEDSEREIELAQWGVLQIEEATEQTFAPYRVLLNDTVTGRLEWLKTKGVVFMAESFQEALRVANEINRKNKLIAIVV